MSERVAFIVNGQPVAPSAPPDAPLLTVLRNDLGLKGARFGCGEGQCGACMVIVDGGARTSCDLPLSAVAGRAVVTVEGLSRDGALHPIQQALLDHQAGQCGYCLSGIIMRAKALLDETPAASRAEIASALDGNLCRCGAHDRILRAIAAAAKAMRR